MNDEISVLLSDLQRIRQTVNAAFHQNEAWDIFDNYRKLNSRPQWSAQTRQLKATIDKLDELIESAKEEDEPPEV